VARSRLGHPLRGAWRLRWGVQFRRNREQDVGTTAPYRLRVREIMGTAAARGRLLSWLDVEIGYAQLAVDVEQTGDPSAFRFTHGTRSEGRAYLAGDIGWRGLRVRLIESFEIDGESYDVVGVHDKGFVQIQATF
jgi:hypothetical protein